MHKQIFILTGLITFGLLFWGKANADVALPDTHYLQNCSKIVNTGEFPDTVFAAVVYEDGIMNHNGELNITVIDSNKCLDTRIRTGRIFYKLQIFAFEKNYYGELAKEHLIDSEILKIIDQGGKNNLIAAADWPADWQLPSTSIDKSLKGNTLEARVIGFTGGNLAIYKAKMITEYNDKEMQASQFDKPKFDNLKISWKEKSTEEIVKTAIGDNRKEEANIATSPVDNKKEIAGQVSVPAENENQISSSEQPENKILEIQKDNSVPVKQSGFWNSVKCFFFKLFGFVCE